MKTQDEAKQKLLKLGFKLISKYTGCKCKVKVICKCGKSFTTSYKKLIDQHTKSCGCIQRKNLLNQRFGRWLVIEEIKHPKYGYKCWKCQCDCGNIRILNSTTLLKGNSNSCGCLRKEIVTGEKAKQWTGYEKISGSLFAIIKCNAEKRNLEFNITIEYLWNIWKQQNGKCALSGLELNLNRIKGTASVDRIDSSKGYVEGNVQWIHKHLNKMKMEFSQDYFINFCNIVSKYQENKIELRN